MHTESPFFNSPKMSALIVRAQPVTSSHLSSPSQLSRNFFLLSQLIRITLKSEILLHRSKLVFQLTQKISRQNQQRENPGNNRASERKELLIEPMMEGNESHYKFLVSPTCNSPGSAEDLCGLTRNTFSCGTAHSTFIRFSDRNLTRVNFRQIIAAVAALAEGHENVARCESTRVTREQKCSKWKSEIASERYR